MFSEDSQGKWTAAKWPCVLIQREDWLDDGEKHQNAHEEVVHKEDTTFGLPFARALLARRKRRGKSEARLPRLLQLHRIMMYDKRTWKGPGFLCSEEMRGQATTNK
jgi:hypothetical protein